MTSHRAADRSTLVWLLGALVILLVAYGSHRDLPDRANLANAQGSVVELQETKTGLYMRLSENGRSETFEYAHANGKSGFLFHLLSASGRSHVALQYLPATRTKQPLWGTTRNEVYSVSIDGREIRSIDDVAQSRWWNTLGLVGFGALLATIGVTRHWLRGRSTNDA
jgi:hypothetical protein